MFVRWQKRVRRQPAFGGMWKLVEGKLIRPPADTHWAAILVESRRIGGRPRQHHVAYLGGICQSAIDLEIPHQRAYFWLRVIGRLDQLGNQVTPEQRRMIEARIAAKVAPPTGDDLVQINASREQYGLPPMELR